MKWKLIFAYVIISYLMKLALSCSEMKSDTQVFDGASTTIKQSISCDTRMNLDSYNSFCMSKKSESQKMTPLLIRYIFFRVSLFLPFTKHINIPLTVQKEIR